MAIPVYVGGVAEISTTTGTGAYTLGGAVPGYTSFADRVSHGATVHYRVTDGSRTEIVRGVFDASANTLSRDVIAEPSSGAVSWGVGRRIIYLDFGDSITSYVSVRAIAGLSPVAISGSAVDLPDLATIASFVLVQRPQPILPALTFAAIWGNFLVLRGATAHARLASTAGTSSYCTSIESVCRVAASALTSTTSATAPTWVSAATPSACSNTTSR